MPNPTSIAQYGDLTGITVLLRASLNVPIDNGQVSNDFRLRRALTTIRYLQEKGARTIVVGHIGRDPEATLKPVQEYFNSHIACSFVSETVGEAVQGAVHEMDAGDVVVLENVRSHPGEKDNDAEFAQTLASYADIYVNDAFAAAHREHASIVGIPKHIPGYLGLVFEEEIQELSRAFDPEHPALFLLGGAKFDTKEPLIEKFLSTYDMLFVGGALAHVLFTGNGWSVGRSLMPDEQPDVSEYIDNDKIIIPTDVIVETEDEDVLEKSPQDVTDGDIIYDSGPRTVDALAEKIHDASFVVWNGPLGNYEKGYEEQTERLAQVIADAQATSIIGGGDTVASISKLQIEEKFSFVSTGGGAMLTFLIEETLPGIEALRETDN